MAKVNKPVKEKEFPSGFGSHSCMIDKVETEKLRLEKIRAMQYSNPDIVDVAFETVREDGQVSLADVAFDFSDKTEYVVCKDQFGLYTTEKWRVDKNMADPNRCAGSRIKLG